MIISTKDPLKLDPIADTYLNAALCVVIWSKRDEDDGFYGE